MSQYEVYRDSALYKSISFAVSYTVHKPHHEGAPPPLVLLQRPLMLPPSNRSKLAERKDNVRDPPREELLRNGPVRVAVEARPGRPVTLHPDMALRHPHRRQRVRWLCPDHVVFEGHYSLDGDDFRVQRTPFSSNNVSLYRFILYSPQKIMQRIGK